MKPCKRCGDESGPCGSGRVALRRVWRFLPCEKKAVPKMNYCRGRRTETAGQQLGAHWNNYATCRDCGKRVKVMKNGRLYPHGTRAMQTPGGGVGNP